MDSKNIKFFWNGLKVAGDRKLIGGHWSHQSAQGAPLPTLPERMRFYFKGFDPRSSDVAVSLGGRGAYSNLDDSFGDAHFDVTPESPLWAVACAMFTKQEEKRIARLERRAAKAGIPPYLAESVAYSIKCVRANIAKVADKPEAAQVSYLRSLGVL